MQFAQNVAKLELLSMHACENSLKMMKHLIITNQLKHSKPIVHQIKIENFCEYAIYVAQSVLSNKKAACFKIRFVFIFAGGE